eukprot:SAG31_NODE_2056_length_6546_cov_1.979060_12_plen_40_part_01
MLTSPLALNELAMSRGCRSRWGAKPAAGPTWLAADTEHET